MSDAIPMLDLVAEVQAYRPELQEAIDEVLETGRFIGGPQVSAFERELAAYLAVSHCITMNSGTDALILGLQALGLGAGDEVITTAFTFVATGSSILHAGAVPVFVDIDPETYNLDIDQVRMAVTEKTKVVVPVHLFGHPVDIPALRSALPDRVSILEDVAQAMSAQIGGRKLGGLGDGGAFSFFPSKNLGAYGDGGAFVTNDDAIAQRVRTLKSHGAKKKYFNEVLGFNSRLDAMQAAILRVKLRRLDEQTAARQAAAKRYNEALEGLRDVRVPQVADGHVFHQYTLRVPAEKRDAIRTELTSAGVSTMIYYPVPLTKMPLFEEYARPLPKTERACSEVLSLPMGPFLRSQQQDRVVAALRSILV